MAERITGPTIDDTANGIAEVLAVDPEKIQVIRGGPGEVVLNHAQARRLLVFGRTTADQLEREYARLADRLTPTGRGILANAVKVLRQTESGEDCPTEAVHVSLDDLFACPKCGNDPLLNQERKT